MEQAHQEQADEWPQSLPEESGPRGGQQVTRSQLVPACPDITQVNRRDRL